MNESTPAAISILALTFLALSSVKGARVLFVCVDCEFVFLALILLNIVGWIVGYSRMT